MDEATRDGHNAEYYGGDDDGLRFQAILSPTGTAIRLSGNGDGGRVTFDLDQHNAAALLWIAAECPGVILDLHVKPRRVASE